MIESKIRVRMMLKTLGEVKDKTDKGDMKNNETGEQVGGGERGDYTVWRKIPFIRTMLMSLTCHDVSAQLV